MKSTNTYLRVALCIALMFALAFVMTSCNIDEVIGNIKDGNIGGALDAITGGGDHEHDYAATVTPATCTEQGFTTYACECGESYVDDYVKAGHDLVTNESKRPTCTDPGYDAYSTCSRCDYTTYHEIPATGHRYETKVTRFPTTLTKGAITTFCSVCGDSSIEEIEAITVTMPSVADAIRAMVGQREITVNAEDSELILIRELDMGDSTEYQKTFLAVELAHLEVSGKNDDLSAYISLNFGVAGFESIEENAVPVFEDQLLINIIVYGDDVSVAITENDSLDLFEYNISEAFYSTVAEVFGMSYEQLVECYYMAGQLSAYLPLAEGVANWLSSIEIPEGNFDIDSLVAILGEEMIVANKSEATTTYTIDISAIGELLVSYKDMTLAQIIDAQYGEGTMAKIEEFIISIPNSKIRTVVNSAIEFSENSGVPIDSVYALINYFVYSASGVDFNIEAELTSRYDMTVAEVIVELSSGEAAPTQQQISEAAKELVANIRQVVDTASAFTVDQLLNIYLYGNPDFTDPEGNPVSVTRQIETLLSMVDDAVYFVAVVDNATDELLMLSVDVEGAFTLNYNSYTNKWASLDIYLQSSYRLNIQLLDGEIEEDITIALYDENDPANVKTVFEGKIYYSNDGTGDGTIFRIKYLDNQVFNIQLSHLSDGTFDKLSVDIYKIVYDYEYIRNENTGYESRTEEMKVHQIIDLDVVYSEGSYIATSRLLGITGIGHSGYDSEGNYVESHTTEGREVAIQTITYTATATGFKITMETVSDETTVQSATVTYTDSETETILRVHFMAVDDEIVLVIGSDAEQSVFNITFNEKEIFSSIAQYEEGELVYADLIINAIVEGKIEGYTELENLLNMVTARYEKGESGELDITLVINDLVTHLGESTYDEEKDIWVEGESVREFINVLNFLLSFDGSQTLTANINGVNVEIVNTDTEVGYETAITVTDGEKVIADVVIAHQTFRDSTAIDEPVISDELHIKGTVNDTDVAFFAIETPEGLDVYYSVDGEEMLRIHLFDDGVRIEQEVVVNELIYVTDSDSPVLENVLTYKHEDYLGTGKYDVYYVAGTVVYDLLHTYSTGTEKLELVCYDCGELVADITVTVTETSDGVDIRYDLKGLKFTSYSYDYVGGGDNGYDDIYPDESYDLEYDGSPVTIVFYHTMGSALRDVLDEYIAKFNEIYPNITVIHEQIGGYDDVRDQIKMEIAGGNQPNIAYCYPDHVALYNIANVVVPLDDFINDNNVGFTAEELENFINGFYNEGTMFDEEGTMYTLPMSKSTELLYYNKTFFEQHGLSVPTTWEEMEALCARILEIDPYCIPFGYDSEANWFITMCQQLGSEYTSATGDHFLFDNETNREFVKMLREWYDKGYFTTQELYGAYTSNLFINENIYMSIGSSAGARYQFPDSYNGEGVFEVGIAPIPQADPYNPKSISQGPSVCIFDQSNKQEVAASWLFVKFLTTNPEFQAEFSMTSGYMPVIEMEALVESVPVYGEWLKSANGLDENTATAYAMLVALENEDSFFVSPAFNGSSKAREEVMYLLQYCLTRQTDDIDEMIAEAFKNAILECEYYS